MFKTLGIPILRGRGFENGDHENAEAVVVLNESMAKWLLPGQNPVGRTLNIGDEQRTIIGVCRDISFPSMRGERELNLQLFLPFLQSPGRDLTLAVRLTEGSDSKKMINNLKNLIWHIDEEVPILA